MGRNRKQSRLRQQEKEAAELAAGSATPVAPVPVAFTHVQFISPIKDRYLYYDLQTGESSWSVSGLAPMSS